METNGDGELIPQRRERYVFRPILIRILEGFFAQTPFPDLNRRIEIATACNQALQIDKKGVGLMPKEVVSPQVVANWFANKRKELRRRSNEELNEANNANFSSQMVFSSEGASTPSPDASQSNTPMESERNDERAASASVPISVPALRPDNCPIAIETSLFQSLRPSALIQSLTQQNLSNIATSIDDLILPTSPTTVATTSSMILGDDDGLLCSASVEPSTEVESSTEQCLAEIQTQLDLVNNSVLALVNPYSNNIHNSVIKVEQTAE
ncbi:unnamed protein product [Dracunculus medinensis]|uniref:Homeobox domain-containing protein n=1 Tax=Dracunculus medinensis TaxID=318479 RepID=A0A3P7PD20_DRAME|nr:unnamed protein product [Dracunculus medinensis]